MRLPARIVLRR